MALKKVSNRFEPGYILISLLLMAVLFSLPYAAYARFGGGGFGGGGFGGGGFRGGGFGGGGFGGGGFGGGGSGGGGFRSGGFGGGAFGGGDGGGQFGGGGVHGRVLLPPPDLSLAVDEHEPVPGQVRVHALAHHAVVLRDPAVGVDQVRRRDPEPHQLAPDLIEGVHHDGEDRDAGGIEVRSLLLQLDGLVEARIAAHALVEVQEHVAAGVVRERDVRAVGGRQGERRSLPRPSRRPRSRRRQSPRKV